LEEKKKRTNPLVWGGEAGGYDGTEGGGHREEGGEFVERCRQGKRFCLLKKEKKAMGGGPFRRGEEINNACNRNSQKLTD